MRGMGPVLGVLIAGAAMLPKSASADLIYAESYGFGVSVDLSILSIPVLTVPRTPYSHGSAAPAYDDVDSVLSLAAGVPLLANLSTGLLESEASSDVDNGVGSRTTMGTALVNDLDLTLVPTLLGPPVVQVSADTIGSTSDVVGDYQSMDPSGSMVLENLAISVAGVGLAIDPNPAPNTVLFDAAGVKIVLNEQTTTDTDTVADQTTNAIHITLTELSSQLGLVSGDVIISGSHAHMEGAVPEPASFLALGGLAAGFFIRKRRR